jgi:hypothetical protein
MQIKLSFHSILAAPQLAQDGTLETRAVKHELIARRQSRIVCATGHALSKNSVPVCARKACARRRAWSLRGGPPVGDWLDVPHCLAEETGVVVFGFGLHN